MRTQELKVRSLRMDDLTAIVRWLDDPAYLAAFGGNPLDPPQATNARERLRHHVNSESGWVAIIDNIRVCALLRTYPGFSDIRNSQYLLIPRMNIEWSLLEDFLIESFANHVDDPGLKEPEAIVRKSHVENRSAPHGKEMTPLQPLDGRRALLLGPLERNRSPIAELRRFGFTVTQSMEPEQNIRHEDFDLIISSGYDRRLSESFVLAHKDRIFNLHAARLPWGRGIGSTLFSQLLDYPLGVSIHLIDSGLDTGDLISEADVQAAAHDTLRTIYSSLLVATNSLFSQTLETYLAGKARRWPQDKIATKSFARSRADFEDVLRLTTKGYDTPLKDVRLLGRSMKALKAAREILVSA